jgi:hypothetical protein
MKTVEEAKTELKEMLDIANLPVKPSYRRGEVCAVLSISDRHFWDLLERFEPGPDGAPTRPDALDSYMHRRERRVRFYELVSFLRRNTTYTRRHAYTRQEQLTLF